MVPFHPKQILFEDNHLLVVNKLSGQLVQGDKTGDTCLAEELKVYLKNKYQKPGNVFCGVIHRLDRPTSGLVIFARTSKALERMNQQFRDKLVRKTYTALVQGNPKETEVLVHFLRKNESQNKSYVVDATQGKEAKLRYRILQYYDTYSLIEIELETGRHHQIRSQMSHIGHPLRGDLKYGAKRSNEDGSICLHASSIEFQHPVNKALLKLEAPIPKNKIWLQ